MFGMIPFVKAAGRGHWWTRVAFSHCDIWRYTVGYIENLLRDVETLS